MSDAPRKSLMDSDGRLSLALAETGVSAEITYGYSSRRVLNIGQEAYTLMKESCNTTTEIDGSVKRNAPLADESLQRMATLGVYIESYFKDYEIHQSVNHSDVITVMRPSRPSEGFVCFRGRGIWYISFTNADWWKMVRTGSCIIVVSDDYKLAVTAYTEAMLSPKAVRLYE
jgi:hypothetical protein